MNSFVDKQLFTLLGLSGLAAVLGLSHLLIGSAQAGPVGSVTANRDFSVVTAKSSNATDTVYILDNRRGLVAVFQYDSTTKQIRPMTVRPLADMLGTPGR